LNHKEGGAISDSYSSLNLAIPQGSSTKGVICLRQATHYT